MKKLISLICLTAVFALATFELSADNRFGSTKGGEEFRKVGAAGVQFLKIGVGARGNGLAGAYSSLVDDLSAVHWNPAGIADVKSMSGEFSYTQWLFDFSHNFAAVSMPMGDNFTIAGHIVSLASSDIPITTIDFAEGTGVNYRVSDVAFGLTLAGYLTDQFSFGITGKYINNTFQAMNSGGIAFDIGTMYQTGIQGIKLGFSIHNLGTEQRYTGQGLRTSLKMVDAAWAAPIDAEYLSYSHNLPIIFRAGISGEVYKDEQHKVDAAFDFTTLSDTPEQFAVGCEYTWKDIFVVRAGYRFGQDQFGLAGGVGVKYLTSQFHGIVDYSIAPTSDIGYVNRITVSLGLGK